MRESPDILHLPRSNIVKDSTGQILNPREILQEIT